MEAISASGKTAISRQGDGQRGIGKHKGPNDEIKFVAVGVSQKGGKFLLVTKGDKHAVLSVRRLGRDPSAELERLEALDLHLLVQSDRTDFLRKAQEATKMKATFEVATQIGWFDGVFILPDRVYPPQSPIRGMPKGWSRILVHLNSKDDDVHSRFHCDGSPKKSQELYRLCRGNTRLIFAAALSFVGPCCKPFGLRAPGIQAVGDYGSGKTVFAVMVGMAFGGIPGSTLGFGSAWNGTPNGLEEYGPALKDTVCILDETSLMPTDQKGRALGFAEALMRLAQGQGKKRYGLAIDRWSNLLVSTSNLSVYALLDAKHKENYGAYTDRLMDIPAPNHGDSFFENLQGFKDSAKFGRYLFDLATNNYGYPIRAFLDRLTSALERDREGLKAIVKLSVAKYEAAAEKISSSLRSVLRVRGYFATVYAVGCLAIRLNILPFTEDELLAAVLSCHRDHVAFVDNEVVGGPKWTVGVQAGLTASTLVMSAAGVAPSPAQLFDRLKKSVNENLRTLHFVNAKTRIGKPIGATSAGYVLRKDGERKELWIPEEGFASIAGGKSEDKALKLELMRRGLIVTEKRGARRNFTVKRKTADGGRPYFVVLRQKAAR